MAPEPWKNSKAKAFLEKELRAGTYDTQSSTEVFNSNPMFQEYDRKNFASNLRSLRQKIIKERSLKPTPEPWGNSKAKALLEQQYAGGLLGTKSADEVFHSNPLFEAYDIDNFKKNFAALKDRVDRDTALDDFDEDAYESEKVAFIPSATTNRGKTRWDGSEAQKQLFKDLEDGEYEKGNPKALWEKRECYHKFFELEVFRKHIHQVLTANKGSVYWTVKNASLANKKKAKTAREAEKRRVENDAKEHAAKLIADATARAEAAEAQLAGLIEKSTGKPKSK